MTKKARLLLLVASLGVAFLAGCELIVDFDRTKIPAEAVDSSVPPRDSSTDTSAPDAGSDATADATVDATPDASPDAASDASSDASGDAADAADGS
ncbi:MAG: hypothetical protein IPK71_19950 [Myxococcales bacterium]|jgi:hypothetical protein|nr:hypothetical protein [Myxococcales bacterium]MBL9110853.1 hypothetical protein [Myxococcales bacterium]